MWSAWRLSVRYERPCRYATGKREKFPSSHVRPRLKKVAYRIDPALWKGHGMGFRQGSLHVWLTVREGSADEGSDRSSRSMAPDMQIFALSACALLAAA
jgi:hypothetical protein